MFSKLSGRKHLGPLDLAPIRANEFCMGMLKLYTLNKLIEEAEHYNKVIEDEDIPEMEKMMAQVIKDQLDIQINSFLGIKEDGSTESNQISD
tara:strand:+ start:326 stop:601 length:276 start_codon:yes stop_codon:yes gene_type:complete